MLEKAAAVFLCVTHSNDTSQFCVLTLKETLELETGWEGNKSYLGAANTMNFIKVRCLLLLLLQEKPLHCSGARVRALLFAQDFAVRHSRFN